MILINVQLSKEQKTLIHVLCVWKNSLVFAAELPMQAKAAIQYKLSFFFRLRNYGYKHWYNS